MLRCILWRRNCLCQRERRVAQVLPAFTSFSPRLVLMPPTSMSLLGLPRGIEDGVPGLAELRT